MKSTGQILVLIFSYLSLGVLLFSCISIKKIEFETPVETTNKYINEQIKSTFILPDLGVYLSNEFDGARLNGVIKENDSSAIIRFNPENSPINNSPYYAFQTWADTPKTFYYTFQYPLGYKHRYIPKIKRKNSWNVIDSVDIFKNDTIITIKINLDKTPIIVAAQEIQSSKDVKNWYENLVKDKIHFIKIKNIGSSTLGRNLPVLDIYKSGKKNKDIIVLLTRQHPPEVTGYYAFQSFLKTIINDSELSNRFLNKYRVLAFPIMNPDGVDLGHWRHNAGGVDLNRDWSKYNQPEIKNAVKYITKTIRKSKSKIILGLDFHSTWYDVFYTNKDRENTMLPNFIDKWFSSLEENIPNYKVNEQAGNSKKPVSKGWFLNGHNAVGITYEIGDKTVKKDIDLMGKVSAEQMMNILLNK